jgi:hypothetical protein
MEEINLLIGNSLNLSIIALLIEQYVVFFLK